MVRKGFSGNATDTTLSTGINTTDTTIVIADSTGWPTGASGTEPFVLVIDPDTDSEEKVLCSSRSGTSCTVSSRGYDDTSASSHTAGAVIWHVIDADTVDEANKHVNDTSDDDHTQYMKTDGTRHDLTARHQFGSAFGTPGAPADVSTSAAAGSGSAPAREDHVHEIAADTINNLMLAANNTVVIRGTHAQLGASAALISQDMLGWCENHDRFEYLDATAHTQDPIELPTENLLDDAVTADKIAAAVAGDGLVGGGGSALDVNVDDATIEVSSDTVQVKDDGVGLAKLSGFDAIYYESFSDDTVSSAGTFEDFGTPPANDINFGDPGTAVHVVANTNVVCVGPADDRIVRVRVGVSLDGGSSFTWSKGGTSFIAGLNTHTVPATLAVDGTPTGDVIVRTQIRQDTSVASKVIFENRSHMTAFLLPS